MKRRLSSLKDKKLHANIFDGDNKKTKTNNTD
jgi:hypothetical protein